MEEIINLNGRQFKLTTDRPLTALEREQAIADIKQQTGCKTCGPRTMANMSVGDDWQYGGISGLEYGTASGCTAGSKAMNQTVSLSAMPTGGTEPYTVNFWVKFGTHALTQAPVGAAGTWTTTGIGEGITVSASYTIMEADMAAGLLGDTTAMLVNGATTTGVPTFGSTASILADGHIRFYSTVVDTCPGGGLTCATQCDVAITCTAPTCNFVVT